MRGSLALGTRPGTYLCSVVVTVMSFGKSKINLVVSNSNLFSVSQLSKVIVETQKIIRREPGRELCYPHPHQGGKKNHPSKATG